MIPVVSMRGRTAAVLGLAKSGLSVCRALHAGGARVLAWDDSPRARAEAAAQGIPLVDLVAHDWQGIDRLVLSPGIPLSHPRPHPLVESARHAGVPVCGDIELLVENQPSREVVGITGTNGKSTTTALLGALLRHAGRGAQVGGNIGLPALDLLPEPEKDLYILELSSYQLDLTENLACAVAVILNVTPDHLDRHGGMAGYVRAKRRILRNQCASDWAVIGSDDPPGEELLAWVEAHGPQRALPIATTRRLERGVFVEDGRLFDGLDGAPRQTADLRGIASLQGAHNWQNAAAAYAAARVLGLAPETIAAGLAQFRGLAHRMEPVAEVDGVRFVNDSKATNAASARRALASYGAIFWIAGGRPKEGGLQGLMDALGAVRHAYLIGEAAPLFARQLRGRVPVSACGELASAVREAYAAARRERDASPVILLSPACASFDQFENFEARGDAFKHLVAQIAAGAPARAGDAGR